MSKCKDLNEKFNTFNEGNEVNSSVIAWVKDIIRTAKVMLKAENKEQALGYLDSILVDSAMVLRSFDEKEKHDKLNKLRKELDIYNREYN